MWGCMVRKGKTFKMPLVGIAFHLGFVVPILIVRHVTISNTMWTLKFSFDRDMFGPGIYDNDNHKTKAY